MKNWSELNLIDGKAYRIKIFKNAESDGYELLVIDEDNSYEVIDFSSKRKELLNARQVFKEMLTEKFPNCIIEIDKSRG